MYERNYVNRILLVILVVVEKKKNIEWLIKLNCTKQPVWKNDC